VVRQVSETPGCALSPISGSWENRIHEDSATYRDLAVAHCLDHTGGMSDGDEFLAWVRTELHDAELALLNGDAGPRRALWSRNEPVSVLGAWRNALGRKELDNLFTALAKQFSNCTSYRFELLAYDIVGDMAYTAGLEHSSVSVDGQPHSYVLRATQIYRREDGAWKVAHRHGDTVIG
jgi:ketosteroid isomerase-like protein